MRSFWFFLAVFLLGVIIGAIYIRQLAKELKAFDISVKPYEFAIHAPF